MRMWVLPVLAAEQQITFIRDQRWRTELIFLWFMPVQWWVKTQSLRTMLLLFPKNNSMSRINYTNVNTRNTCVISSSSLLLMRSYSKLLKPFCQFFFKTSIWQKISVYYNSFILTLSQVRHCTELMIVPSKTSEITLRYFLCCFFLFGDDADWARTET